MLRYHNTSSKAFTLLELSIVLGILSLLVAGIMSVTLQNTRRAATAEVKRKMDIIESELLKFRQLNGRLPCPADSGVAISGQYFGVEGVTTASASTTCKNGSTYSGTHSLLASDGGTPADPAATFYDAADTFTVAGDVPVKTLGLGDDYMFDPWGGRFLYAVDMRMTTNNTPFTTYNAYSASIGSILVTDASANNKVTVTSNAGGAIAVLMSYGPDGHGAFQLSGTRKSSGNNLANTKTNCHCTSAAVAAAWTNPATFIQAVSTTTGVSDPSNFDDIVRFYMRSSFLNATDVALTR